MLVGGILCYVFRQRVQTTMQQEMLRTIRFYGDDRAITRAWDDLQEGVSRDRIKAGNVFMNAVLIHDIYVLFSRSSYTVVGSLATMTGGSTGLAESFPAAVVKRSTER